MSVAKPLLSLQRVSAAYPGRRGRRLVVRDADLTVHRGEMHGLVGESGSGKTTLARVAAFLHTPVSGSIALDGMPINHARSARGRVQMVFQEPRASLNPRWTVRRSIARPLWTLDRQRATDAQIEQLLDLVGLPADLQHRYPHQLSGGQAQRVAIARAIITQPDLLIADEALSGLDVTTQVEVLELVERLRQERDMAVLFVSHDLRVVSEACTTVSVMAHGRIVETISATSLLTSARSEVTKRLLADMVPSF